MKKKNSAITLNRISKMDKDHLWYQNAVFYQLHVKCFHDSNGDGIGDFKGLTKKLDYIQNLGCTAIWLLPFYPSPMKDDGYDIADYCNIHPDYGTLKDFRQFLKEAHKRNIKVVTELVINHTSDQHKWFQRSRQAKPGTKWHNYYVWSDTCDKYQDARVIFKDFEKSNWAWDPDANAYYWHRFYSSQPDLNYDNPEVHKEIFKIVDFWLDLGVDGMRLDAIPYLYQREGTDCENLPETHQFLKKLRAFVDSKYTDRMLLAEANQWPEHASSYFGNEDECHMAFHFPVMPRLFMSIQMEDRFPITDIMEQTPTAPGSCQWAMFLRNHDELTLEMVTDEERDFMYRAYAKDPKARINLGIRRRLAPLLENDRMKIELLNILLLSLPGSPVIYYGDEIGMGDNYYLGDRDGVRTPMQWSTNTNAGFSDGNPQKLFLPLIIDPEYHHAYLNVQNQEQTVSSLLRWMRSIINVRHQNKAFGCGTIRFLQPANSKVLAFVREYQGETILIVANLSRHSQCVELDLSEFSGFRPKDLFSQNEFSLIKDSPYGLTLSRYGYYWLSLEKSREKQGLIDNQRLFDLSVTGKWTDVFKGETKSKLLNKILPNYLLQCRWYRGKAKTLSKLSFVENKAIHRAVLTTIEARYCDDTTHIYLLPITYIPLEEGLQLAEQHPKAMITRIKVGEEEGFLIDAIYDESFRHSLFNLALDRKQMTLSKGSIRFSATAKMRRLAKDLQTTIQSKVLNAEQSNTSIIYNDTIILKLYRYLEEGVNPDLQMTKFLTEQAHFQNVPEHLGVIETKQSNKSSTLALFQKFIPNSGDIWSYTLDALNLYFENAISHREKFETFLKLPHRNHFTEYEPLPEELREYIGFFFIDTIKLLGKRTGEMHISLASSPKKEKEITPEPFSQFYQKSLYQGMRSQLRKVFTTLRSHLSSFDEETQSIAEHVLNEESNLLETLKNIREHKFGIKKIRIHGDYHLGQVLFTGNDVMIIDFEGEPIIPLSERCLKRSVLQDIASMIRSLHYASTTALLKQKVLRPENSEKLEPIANLWYQCISKEFLHAYLNTVEQYEGLTPTNHEDLQTLLHAYLLNKAIYETHYELQSRPEWIKVPLKGILMLTGSKNDE
jgi:maltose alpha-D-glucosyltransferase / alpha-amylase